MSSTIKVHVGEYKGGIFVSIMVTMSKQSAHGSLKSYVYRLPAIDLTPKVVLEGFLRRKPKHQEIILANINYFIECAYKFIQLKEKELKKIYGR